MTEKSTRGRQRSREAKEAILTATSELLVEKPLRDISVEAIALRAGVGKATIYRWWPTKAYVALDAYLKVLTEGIRVPDTGEITNDLTVLLRSSIAFAATSEGAILGQILAEAQHDPQFAKVFRDTILMPRREVICHVLDRATKRGEIDPVISNDFIIDLLYAPLIFRMMVGLGPPSMEADAIISAIMDGIGGPNYRISTPLSRQG